MQTTARYWPRSFRNLPCFLCNLKIDSSQIAIMLPRGPTYHAACLHNEGGEQLCEARELWKGMDHVGSWDAMIASQTGTD